MAQRDVMLLTGPRDYPVTPPKFARRKVKGKGFEYEYGYTTICHEDRKKDKDTVLGKAPTLAEAMKLNGMEPLCSGQSLAM